MADLSIPSFVIGLTGLAAVFDKACIIWRTIAQAREYGQDVANSMSKIEMEYFRFQTWWTVLETLTADPRNRVVKDMTLSQSPIVAHLQTNIKSPVAAATANVVLLLEELEKILTRNGMLKVASRTTNPSPATITSTGSGPELMTETNQYRVRRENFGRDLLKSTSWFRRLTYNATPWKSVSEKMRIQEIHGDLKYWNDSLYDILPHNIRESVLQQGIAGFVLENEENAMSLLKLTGQELSSSVIILEYVRLREIRHNTRIADQKANMMMEDILTDMRITLSDLRTVPTEFDQNKLFSVLCYKQQPGFSPSNLNVLVEWYPCPPSLIGLDTWKITEQRIARLSYLLTTVNRPRTLHSLHTLGFLGHPGGRTFGLVSRFPDWSSSIHEPVTLHQLLSRNVPTQLPSLDTKYELAAYLASTLYTFMLTKWYHKRYNSCSVYFLSHEDVGSQRGSINLSKPFVGGFSISRPDASNEDTFEGIMTPELEIYLHPDVRLATSGKRPQFRRSFEIYSFGVLLAEIGFWNVLPKIASGKAKSTHISPMELSNLLIKKCQTDLACWMGERYRDVTLRCLAAAATQDSNTEEDLNDFYWLVVLELMKCVP